MSPASYLAAPPRVAGRQYTSVDALFWAALGLFVVALIGAVVAYRGHRKVLPLILGVLSVLAVLYSLNTGMNVKILYPGLAGLVVVAIWNSIEARRCADICQK